MSVQALDYCYTLTGKNKKQESEIKKLHRQVAVLTEQRNSAYEMADIQKDRTRGGLAKISTLASKLNKERVVVATSKGKLEKQTDNLGKARDRLRGDKERSVQLAVDDVKHSVADREAELDKLEKELVAREAKIKKDQEHIVNSRERLRDAKARMNQKMGSLTTTVKEAREQTKKVKAAAAVAIKQSVKTSAVAVKMANVAVKEAAVKTSAAVAEAAEAVIIMKNQKRLKEKAQGKSRVNKHRLRAALADTKRVVAAYRAECSSLWTSMAKLTKSHGQLDAVAELLELELEEAAHRAESSGREQRRVLEFTVGGSGGLVGAKNRYSDFYFDVAVRYLALGIPVNKVNALIKSSCVAFGLDYDALPKSADPARDAMKMLGVLSNQQAAEFFTEGEEVQKEEGTKVYYQMLHDATTKASHTASLLGMSKNGLGAAWGADAKSTVCVAVQKKREGADVRQRPAHHKTRRLLRRRHRGNEGHLRRGETIDRPQRCGRVQNDSGHFRPHRKMPVQQGGRLHVRLKRVKDEIFNHVPSRVLRRCEHGVQRQPPARTRGSRALARGKVQRNVRSGF